MIPKQLKNPLFRFILIGSNGKIPLEKQWQTVNNYEHNSVTLQTHIKNKGNYGVATGFGNLVVLDFDSLDAYNKVCGYLPDTFSVLSASKKYPHLYYIVDKPEPKTRAINDNDNNRLIDVQGQSRQVVGPGSFISKKKYSVWRNVPIAVISYDSLMLMLKQNFPKHQEHVNRTRKITNISSANDVCDIISVKQVAERLGSSFKRPYHGDCPLHSSNGGICFHVNESDDRFWYCFSCQKGGNIINLVADKFSISNHEAIKWIKKEFRLE